MLVKRLLISLGTLGILGGAGTGIYCSLQEDQETETSALKPGALMGEKENSDVDVTLNPSGNLAQKSSPQEVQKPTETHGEDDSTKGQPQADKELENSEGAVQKEEQEEEEEEAAEEVQT